ncbi:hypothetical protein Q4540_04635 [Pseudoalteromonas carrageenovora]|uniref:hypothetical protein n=1 Tax=Pseudoalteromonas carrageenovora TaxID=227 RepID=UPI0026E3255A|nr:hypothetical protein [Pseudoalteromonas carrageenovora]MDO6635778.1 hypothetical protein [Pseudoalteromonas carrageenovora]MDO6647771.1 hypothetical protein [Pseudoalteromonas carrageenovora]
MKVLILESELHHCRSRVFDINKHFPDADIDYSGNFCLKKNISFFLQYDLIVSTVYTSPTSNYIVSKCRQLGIKTLLLSDGIIEWENLYNNQFLLQKRMKLYSPVYHEYFAVMGKLEGIYFETINTIKCVSFTPSRVGVDKFKDKEVMNTRFDFLLTSANRIYLNEKEKIESFEIYINIFKTLCDMDVSFKIRIFDEDLINEFRQIKADILNDIDSTFEDCISNVSGVLTGPSSIVFPAMYRNIAVAQILYRNSPVFTQTGWYVNSINSLRDTLESMLEPDRERLAFQHSVLVDHIESKSLTEQLNFDENKIPIYNEKDFFSSKYVFNLEPYFRYVDDFLKLYSPKAFVKWWKKVISKYR